MTSVFICVYVCQSYHFRKPVQAKVVPDYYTVIKFPMDLQTMKEVRKKSCSHVHYLTSFLLVARYRIAGSTCTRVVMHFGSISTSLSPTVSPIMVPTIGPLG